MSYRINILLMLLALATACNEPLSILPVPNEISIDTLINIDQRIDEIIIEDDAVNIRSENDFLKYSLDGQLLETRKYHSYDNFKLIKGGYVSLERMEEYHNPNVKGYFIVREYSNVLLQTDVKKIDTLRTSVDSLWTVGDILLANNYDLSNDNQIGAISAFQNNTYWTNYSFELFSHKSGGKFELVRKYSYLDELVRHLHSSNYLYAYKDGYLFFGNFNFHGDAYTKDFYVIKSDGTYKKAHSKENEDEEVQVFEYQDKLYANYKSENYCRLFSSTDQENWDLSRLDFSFTYLGVIDSMLIGKVNNKIGILNLESKQFNEFPIETDLSDCVKIVQYKNYTYFVISNIYKNKYHTVLKLDTRKLNLAI